MKGPESLAPEASADLAALWRIVELCLPSHKESGAATFLPRGSETLAADWESWLAAVHAPIIRPALPDLHNFASAAALTSLLGADAALSVALPAPEAQRSLAAGRRALLDFRPPQGTKLLERLRDAAAHNLAAGHLATVFAVRAHAFHLPAVQTASALLLAECVLGASATGVTLSARQTAELLSVAGRAAAPPAQLIAV